MLYSCSIAIDRFLPFSLLTPSLFSSLLRPLRGITWGDDGTALVHESWFKTRHTRTWAVPVLPSSPISDPVLVFDRSYEDRYSDPGSPLLRRTPDGTYVLAQVQLPGGGLRLLLAGDGATPEGNIPFLDLFDW